MSEACKTPSPAAPECPEALEDFQPYPAYGKSAAEVRRMENRVLGRMMRELRQAADLPLARIAEETGHPPEQILAIEEGRHPSRSAPSSSSPKWPTSP